MDEESDENLIEMIVSSIVKLKIHVVNLILIQMNKRELVFERVRYIYNDVLEHFERNFAREITDLQMRLFLKVVKRMKKQNQTYNDGILELLVQQTLYDRYHTKIGSDYSTFKRFWFRKLGITSEEQYFAMQVDTVVIMRVAISKTTDINSHMKVKINGKVYGISRVYHNYNKMKLN